MTANLKITASPQNLIFKTNHENNAADKYHLYGVKIKEVSAEC